MCSAWPLAMSRQFGALEEMSRPPVPGVGMSELTCEVNDTELLCAYGQPKEARIIHHGLLKNLICRLSDLAKYFALASLPTVRFDFNSPDSGGPRFGQSSFCLHSIEVNFRECMGTLVLPLHGNQQLETAEKLVRFSQNLTLPYRKRLDRAIWRGGKNQHGGSKAWRSALIKHAHQWDPQGKLLDVSFTKESLSFLASHKIIIVVDGLGQFSGLIKFALLSGSVILKIDHMSSFGEWFELYMVPYKHYVPVRFDQEDLLDSVHWILNNPAVSEKIAQSAWELGRSLFTENFLYCHVLSSLRYMSHLQRLDDKSPILPRVDIRKRLM